MATAWWTVGVPRGSPSSFWCDKRRELCGRLIPVAGLCCVWDDPSHSLKIALFMPCMYVLLRRGSGRDTLSYGMADKDTHPHHYLPHSSSSPTPASRYRHQQHNLRQQQQPQKAHQKAHHPKAQQQHKAQQQQRQQQQQRHSSGSSSSNALAAAPASTSASAKARSFRDDSLISPKKKKLKLILKLRKPLQDSPPALPPPQGVRSKGLGSNGAGSAGLGSPAAGSSASGTLERGLGPSPTQPRTLHTRSAVAGNGLAGPIAAAAGGGGFAPVELHRKGAAATSASASESTEAAEDEGLHHFSKKRKLRDVPDLKNEEEKTSGMAAAAVDDASKRRLKDKEPGSNGLSAPGELHGSSPQQKMFEELLDRFQKKDTYGVFAEPVDPAEIPDYHDIIKEPMDFSTVRKKLLKGVYTSLELFEKDIMLICSNAMRYNAPRTIYYKQAKSIKDTARKAFDAQKGRLNAHRKGGGKQNSTMKKSKRSASTKRSAEAPSSDHPSGAALATTDGKRTSTIDRVADLSHKSNSPFQNCANDLDFPEGSLGRAMSLKDGRRVLTVDENRRNTYRPPGFSDDDSPTQLVPFGYQSGGAYAQSLALFGANFNRSTWEFVARKIRKVLAPNVPFGPGWVGEQETSVTGFTTDVSVSVDPSKENAREEAKDTPSGETGTPFSVSASMSNGSGVFPGVFSGSTLSTVGVPVPLASRPSLASSACTPCGPSTGRSSSAAGTSSGFFPVPDHFIRPQTQNISVAAPAQNSGKHWQNSASSGSSLVTSQLRNVEANAQQLRNMEANSQPVRNVDTNLRQFRNVEANPQQFRSVDASPQEHRNFESNAQQFRGAEASPQQLKKGDANVQQLRNVEANSQHFKNMEQQIRHEGNSQLFRNLEANSQQHRNVDSQSRKLEINAQQVRNADANSQNSQHLRNLEVGSQQSRSNVDATSQQLRKLESSQQLRSLDSNSQQLRNVEANSQQLRSSRDANSQQLRNSIDANPQQLRNSIDVNSQQQQLRSSMDVNSQQQRSMDVNSQQQRSMDANSQQLRSSIGANSQQLRSSMDANPQQLRTGMDTNSQQLRKLDQQLRNVDPNQFRNVDGNSGHRFQLQKDHQGNISSIENQETNKYPGPKFAGNVNNGSMAFPGADSARGVWSLQRVLGQESAARDSLQRVYGQEQVTSRSCAEAGPLNFAAIPSMFPNMPAFNRVGVDRDAAALVQGRDLFQLPGLNGQSLMAKMPGQVQPSRPETQQHRFMSDLNSRSEVSNGDFFRSHGQGSSSSTGEYQKDQMQQMGVYNAISQSLLQPWKSVPSHQRLVQQAPSSLRPLPPDLNVRLQSPKSPQQQSQQPQQQQQQHQQPDLALQL